MRDWILGLQKAAIEHKSGVGASEWLEAERELGLSGPDDLRELYQQLSGATFASGVVLYPLSDASDPRGVIAQSRSGSAGFPADDVWRFGRKDNQHLAALRKGRLSELNQADAPPPPEWLDDTPDDAWVYLARDESSNRLRMYRSLELLLTSLVPPAESEDFGERTLARARSLVEAAVTELSSLGNEVVEQLSRITRRRPAKKKKPVARRKAAPKKKPAAKPKRKPAAPKKKPAPAKRKPAPKKKKTAAKKRR